MNSFDFNTFGVINEILEADEDLKVSCESSPISINNYVSSILRFFVKIIKPKNILELGTLHGRSAILMSRFSAQATIHSIENNPENYRIAQDNVKKNSLQNRIKLYLGDCQKVLQSDFMQNLQPEILFIDANKLKYAEYLDWACNFSSSGATIIIDNIFVHRILEKYRSPDCKMNKTMQDFLKKIHNKDIFDTMIIPYERDGLAVLKKANTAVTAVQYKCGL